VTDLYQDDLFSDAIPSPVGQITAASDGQALTGLWIAGQRHFGGTATSRSTQLPLFDHVREWLTAYFAGENPSVDAIPLNPRGGLFRQTVWRILLEIPYGQVSTYGAVAKEAAARLGKPRMSAQAVGGAVGHNPISIIIPCHRVVGANGSLTGYGGGIPTKIKLLETEGTDLSGLFTPKTGAQRTD
jgi:methylated-DNA-[protein]-cysteine S-methyltransferase